MRLRNRQWSGGPPPRRIREREAGTGTRRERDGPAPRRAPPGRAQRARGPRPADPGVLLQTLAKPDNHGGRPALADTAARSRAGHGIRCVRGRADRRGGERSGSRAESGKAEKGDAAELRRPTTTPPGESHRPATPARLSQPSSTLKDQAKPRRAHRRPAPHRAAGDGQPGRAPPLTYIEGTGPAPGSCGGRWPALNPVACGTSPRAGGPGTARPRARQSARSSV